MDRSAFHRVGIQQTTVAALVASAVIALATGAVSHCIALVAFGVISAIQALPAAVLAWRLAVDARGREAEFAPIERIARSVASLAFVAAGIAVILKATVDLVRPTHETPSTWGMLGALATAALLSALLRARDRIKGAAPRMTLHVDAVSLRGYVSLALATGLGLAFHRIADVAWAEFVTAAAIGAFAFRQGYVMYRLNAL